MTSALTLEALPLLAEMGLVVKLLPEVFRQNKLPDELTLLPPGKGSAFVADAFTNPTYMHFVRRDFAQKQRIQIYQQRKKSARRHTIDPDKPDNPAGK